MRTIFPLFVLTTILSTFAGGQNPPRTVSVTGHGTVTSTPDMATITTGVVTAAAMATDALDENSAIMNEIFVVLMGSPYNVAEKDMQTTSFQIYPVYNYTFTPPELVGYRVTNTVSINVRNLEVLGQLLDAVVEAGGNQVGGISFGFNNATALSRTAQINAVKDAQRRAALYADAANVTLGDVLSILEAGAVQYDADSSRGSQDQAEAAVPIASGEEEISASIHLVYEIVG